MRPLQLVLVGIASAGAGFLVGAWWAARKVGNSLAKGLSKAIGTGMISKADASDILDFMDEG
jgi:hypothetical protein